MSKKPDYTSLFEGLTDRTRTEKEEPKNLKTTEEEKSTAENRIPENFNPEIKVFSNDDQNVSDEVSKEDEVTSENKTNNIEIESSEPAALKEPERKSEREVEPKKSENKTKRKYVKKEGRGEEKSSDENSKYLSFRVPSDLEEHMEIARTFYSTKTEYVLTLIRKDAEENKARYDMIRKIKKEMESGRG